MPVASILDPIRPTLSPLLWDHPEAPEPTLKPRHATFIKKMVYGALQRHGYHDPHTWLRLVLTGSLTTYQYGEDSDCDVSLFVNSQALPEWSRAEMIGIMIQDVDGTVIPGTPYPLQDFVVAKRFLPGDLYRPGLRSGYDIDTERWIVPPEKDRVHNVQAQDYGAYAWAMEMADKMERLLRYEPDKAEQFWHQIHRKRQRDQAAGKGDYSESNIVYKFLAKRGLLPQIAELTGEHIAARGESPWEVTLRTMRRDGFSEDEIEDWSNYLAAHNEADRDSGELHDVPDEQVERWYENWESEGRPRIAWTLSVDGVGDIPDVGDAVGGSRVVEMDNLTTHLEDGRALPLEDAQALREARTAAGEQQMLDANAGQDLQGLPGPVNVPGYGPLQFHSNADIQRVANEYNQAYGLGPHPTDYLPVHPPTSQQIAAAYDQMQHAPQDPQVAAAYQALAQESMAQYRHAVNNGYRFEFYPEQDPYPNSPREAVMDLHRNRHMYVYPTESGYGDGQQGMDHPLLADSGERWNGRPVTYNDIFRAIHDFYGHAKEGLGFRGHGEDNAYRQHAAMFSPQARQALASETRGQNSWVNFGPHGEQNQTANQAETVYAPQKAGLLPEWISDPDLHAQGTFARVAASDIANHAYQATLANGGITVGLDGTQPTTGYAFPPSKSEEQIIPLEQLTPDAIDHFIADWYGDLREPGHFLGLWVDGDSVYLDVSIVEPDYATAFQRATEGRQIAMWDLGTGQEIPVLRSAA